jgi:perosamine synthetase
MSQDRNDSSARGAPRIRLARPDIGEDEVAAVRSVLLSGVLTNGPRTAHFEAAFSEQHQVEHAIAMASGTVALTAVYRALGLGPGDEVIVPSMTFVSSATSIMDVGATPVFCDIDSETFNLCPEDVLRRITRRTRAILAVHYGGQPADLSELQAIAADTSVTLIEDAAEAHGASYRGRPVGGFGRAAVFSFTPTKNITTGEGGIVTTDDAALADRLRLLRNHGQIAPYLHVIRGSNWRMTEIQAAIGILQLEKLGGILERKQVNARWMRQRLLGVDGIRPPAVRDDRTHTYMLYTVLVPEKRDFIVERLNDVGIEARVYFPPVHRQPIFCTGRWELPVTDEIGPHMLSIPFHSRLTSADLEEISSRLSAVVAEVSTSHARGPTRWTRADGRPLP